MRGFVKRALEKISKLDLEQIRKLLRDVAGENERLAVVLDSMNDGVIVSNEEHRVVLVNKAAERLVPLQPVVVAEPTMWELIADDDIAAFVRQALSNEDTVSDREFALDGGGQTRVLNCSILPLVQAGHIRGSILHVADISEKRAREARLRRVESLASLTTLAAGVAHEIKNPLGSIGIHTQLIQKSFASALAAGQLSEQSDSTASAVINNYLEIIDEEIQRLNKIVVDFLFAVRPMDTKLTENDLNEVVGDLLSFVRYELEQAGIDCVADLDPEVPALQLDEKYLKQAILNIVKNAISAMPDGGTLRVATQLRGDTVLLRISDNGVGMSDAVMAKIFEPYFTTKEFGSGIGLTLVYKVIKEHMGDISVLSKEGAGTTFTITFPVPQRETRLLHWDSP